MSYEPTLLIKKTDLDKHSAEFEKFWEWKNNEDEWGDISWLKCAKIDDATKKVG